ncbi:hypothetical protein ACLB2K_030315 [Fragaria x ananassa]
MALSSLRLLRTISSPPLTLCFLSSIPVPQLQYHSQNPGPFIQSRPFDSLYGKKGGTRSSGSLSWIFREAQSLGLRRWRNMAFFATAEVCDTNTVLLGSGDLRVLPPVFQMYGQCRAFSGPISTIKVFEDNVLVRELLETRGEGRVLVIDGGGSMRCALVGGNLGQLAQNMGWAGIVVNGCIRDVDEINGCDIGVRALASHPMKSNKRGHGDKHVPINIAGTLIREGEWLYADSDGILISTSELSI